LWGRAAPVDELQEVASEHGIALLFDAAHSFGVSSGGRMVGGFGNAEVFSFHATKFFNTLEGGAIVTNDDVLATRLRLMRNFGFAGEDNVISEGSNGKMNEVCAAMGLVNLDIIDDVVEINERNYRRYETGLVGIRGLSLFQVDSSEQSNYQYVVLLVDDAAGVPRDDILATLRANNVLARRYFWPSAHRMEPYRTLNPDAGVDLPITEWVSDRVIVLPTGTAVDETSIDKIIHLIRRTVEGN
jgi:dTDP-4-amino-4,6-dideoxygalactose transaminase